MPNNKIPSTSTKDFDVKKINDISNFSNKSLRI